MRPIYGFLPNNKSTAEYLRLGLTNTVTNFGNVAIRKDEQPA